MIVLYSKPGCGPCRATEHALQSRGTPYRKVDVSTDAEALAFVTHLGYRGVPVVWVDENDHWSGFDADRLARIS